MNKIGLILLSLLLAACSEEQVARKSDSSGEGQEQGQEAAAQYADAFLAGLRKQGLSPEMESCSLETPVRGLKYFRMDCLFTDPGSSETSAQNRTLYIFDVDLASLTLRATLPWDIRHEVLDPSNWELQRTSAQLSCMDSYRNITVYGGVNGDLYDRSATNRPYGVMAFNGTVVLKAPLATDTRPAFAVTEDGKAHCIADGTLPGHVRDAVCGRVMPLRGGTVTTTRSEPEPRTCVGVNGDGTRVWLMVIDGRGNSSGASYKTLGLMMKALGACDAINLDGGGSSTFVRKSGNALTVLNVPSDGTERAVANGLAVTSL